MGNSKNLTLRQEHFARAYVETGNASEAYRRSYTYENMTQGSIAVEGHRHLHHPKIAHMINAMRQEVHSRFMVNMESITEELEWARTLATETGNPSAAVAAVLGKAKLHGLLKDRIDLTGHVQVANTELLKKLNPDERAVMRGILTAAAARTAANQNDAEAGVGVPQLSGGKAE